MNATAGEMQLIARQAGIELSEERAEGLIVAMQGMEVAARRLATVDYGSTEPSGRFRAPKPEAT